MTRFSLRENKSNHMLLPIYIHLLLKEKGIEPFMSWFTRNKEQKTPEFNAAATKRLNDYITEYEEDEESDVKGNEHLVKPSLYSRRNEILQNNEKVIEKATKELSKQVSPFLPTIDSVPVKKKLFVEEITEDNVKGLEEVSFVTQEDVPPYKELPMNDEPINESYSQTRIVEDNDIELDLDADIDFDSADMETILKNLDEDPFADTNEILETPATEKYVDVNVIYDERNQIASRTFRFRTRSFTSFQEDWDEQIYRNGYYSNIDIQGNSININPNKCYTVEVTKIKNV